MVQHAAYRPWLLTTALPAPAALVGDGSEGGSGQVGCAPVFSVSQMCRVGH